MDNILPVSENIVPLSVSAYIDYLNTLLDIQKVVIRGEIGDKINRYPNFSFFNLKDPTNSKAMLGCFVWDSVLRKVGIPIEEGMEIEVYGYAHIRAERGELKFQVERISVVGEGALRRLFEYLQQQLASEGLFEAQYKTPVPSFARKIGLITSAAGRGAKKDFLTNLGEYGFAIDFYDVRVEGDTAIGDVTKALRWFNENNTGYDAIVLIRGGGSWESLRAFNSEDVARAIFASKIPVIVGIGHEDDTTIACLVADKRVSTPTAVAHLLNEPWEKVSMQLSNAESGIMRSVANILREKVQVVKSASANFDGVMERVAGRYEKNLNHQFGALNSSFNGVVKNFDYTEQVFVQNGSKLSMLMNQKDAQILLLHQKLDRNMEVMAERLETKVVSESEKLSLASPELKLKQGYSITLDDRSGKVVKHVADVTVGMRLQTVLADGSVLSNVNEIVSLEKGGIE